MCDITIYKNIIIIMITNIQILLNGSCNNQVQETKI